MSTPPPPPPKRVPADASDVVAYAESLSAQVGQTMKRASSFGETELQQGVNGEWSTVQSLRHLVLVVDLWLSKAILGEPDPFDPVALPPHFVGPTIPGTSIDSAAQPTFADACSVLEGRLARVRAYAAIVSDADLSRAIQAHAGTVAGGLAILFDELAAHDFYINRDLDAIEHGRA